MEMRHFLAAVLAHVGEQAVALRLQSEVLRDRADSAHEPGDLFGPGAGAEVGERNVLARGDHLTGVDLARCPVCRVGTLVVMGPLPAPLDSS